LNAVHGFLLHWSAVPAGVRRDRFSKKDSKMKLGRFIFKLAPYQAGFYHQTSIEKKSSNLWERLSSRDRRGWKATPT